MTTTTRHIAAVAAVAALVLVGLWYVALFHPATQKLASAHRAEIAAGQKTTQLNGQIAQLQALQKQIPLDTARLATLQAAIPEDPSLATALVQLHRAATNSGATLSSVGPSTPTGPSTSGAQTSGPPSITLSLIASGSYGQITAFLSQLANMPRTLVIDSLNLSGGGSKLSANISARIFYVNDSNP
jgi:Tfp pilus assembly protein PilO